MKTTHIFFLFSLLFLGTQISTAQTSTVNYTTSTDDFVNPERGFYRYSETFASNYTTLDSAEMVGYRSLHTPTNSADYDVYSSLVFRYFVLDDFVSSNITQDFLDSMAVDFAAARAAGVKLIPRFAYTIEATSGTCEVGWICPLYGDADKAQMLTHIAQLKPVLQANADVIAVAQMGFIGTWGENYYTDHFGDASPNGQGYLSSQNWTDRKDILAALLDAVPAERMVQVRYPQMKQKFLFGNTATTDASSSPPINPAQAYDGSDIARIGFHNDCLMASAADFGTFTSYDNSPFDDTTNLKPYFANDSRYTAVGGETCSDGYNPFNNCVSTGGNADQELRRLHYSYLNSQYQTAVNNDWVSGGCMEDIKKELGYRLALQEGTFSDEAQPGQLIAVDIELVNEGYAAPFNLRGVELVLRNSATNETWFAKLTDDPRFWLSHGATHDITATLCIPPNMPFGNYDLLLNLPDPMASIYARSEYAIRLANQLPGGADVWEAATGYNNLGHSININSTASNMACSGESGFIRSSAYSDFCTQNLVIEGLSVPTGQYHSEGELTSLDTNVEDGETVLFQSDTGVTLTEDFDVALGGVLDLEIGGCGN